MLWNDRSALHSRFYALVGLGSACWSVGPPRFCGWGKDCLSNSAIWKVDYPLGKSPTFLESHSSYERDIQSTFEIDMDSEVLFIYRLIPRWPDFLGWLATFDTTWISSFFGGATRSVHGRIQPKSVCFSIQVNRYAIVSCCLKILMVGCSSRFWEWATLYKKTCASLRKLGLPPTPPSLLPPTFYLLRPPTPTPTTGALMVIDLGSALVVIIWTLRRAKIQFLQTPPFEKRRTIPLEKVSLFLDLHFLASGIDNPPSNLT
jgi:hypothetical protein